MNMLRFVAMAVFALAGGAGEGQALQYTITEIGTLGGSESYALAINDNGRVVGWSTLDTGERRAFVWNQGELTPLGTLGGATSEAFDINEAGIVVGQADTAAGATHAFYWDGAIHDFQTLPEALYSIAWSINENGEAVGGVLYDGDIIHAFYSSVYGSPVSMVDFHSIDAGPYSEALAINDVSEIAGAFVPKDEADPQAYLGSLDELGPRMTGLGTFGGSQSLARANNNRGEVVGWAMNDEAFRHAFFWDGTTMRDLNRLDESSEAGSVNESSVVVGISYNHVRSQGRAFAWTPGGQMEDLSTQVTNGAGWTLRWARDVNNLGWIVGEGFRNGQRRGFLLKPVAGPGAGDVDGDGSATAVDVQLVVNGVLGVDTGGHDTDVNDDDRTDALDVQAVINGVLGAG